MADREPDEAYFTDDEGYGLQRLFQHDEDYGFVMAVDHRQAAAIPLFAGTIGADAKVFTDTVEDMKRLHTWNNDQTYNTAITRLTSEAKRWFMQQRPLNKHPTKWDEEAADPAGTIYLKNALLARFYDDSTAKQRVAATKDLKQRPDEDIRLFHDRVVEACMISTHELKEEANYARILKNAVKQQLINGALDKYAEAVAMQADMPDDPSDIVKLMLNVSKKDTTAPLLGDTFSTHEVAAVNNRTFRPPAQRSGPRPAGPKTRCFNCNLLGHFSRDCRKPRKNRNRNSNPNNGPRPNVHAVSADHISRANNYNGNPGHLATPMMVDAEPFTVSLAQGN